MCQYVEYSEQKSPFSHVDTTLRKETVTSVISQSRLRKKTRYEPRCARLYGFQRKDTYPTFEKYVPFEGGTETIAKKGRYMVDLSTHSLLYRFPLFNCPSKRDE